MKVQKVQVSRLFKALCGRDWRDEAKSLVQDAMDAIAVEAEMTGRKCDTHEASIQIPVVITVSKDRATVDVSLDYLSELEECEIRMET
ncbi:MAG: hypothetical protein ABSG86_21045 [Thermoguttaceae bacterium]|jgi:hypothetical protein